MGACTFPPVMGISLDNLPLETGMMQGMLDQENLDWHMGLDNHEIQAHRTFMRGVTSAIYDRVEGNTDRWLSMAAEHGGGYKLVFESVLCGELWRISEDGLFALDMVGMWHVTRIDRQLQALEARLDHLEPRVLEFFRKEKDEEMLEWASDAFKLVRQEVLHYAFGAPGWDAWNSKVQTFNRLMMIRVRDRLVDLLQAGVHEDLDDVWEHGGHYNDALGSCLDPYILMLDYLYLQGEFSTLLQQGLRDVSSALTGAQIDTSRIVQHERWGVLDRIIGSMHTILGGVIHTSGVADGSVLPSTQ